jgi:hypothetical protein
MIDKFNKNPAPKGEKARFAQGYNKTGQTIKKAEDVPLELVARICPRRGTRSSRCSDKIARNFFG